MRNPDRIEPILNELKNLWLKYPDLRLGQLVCLGGLDHDPFYVEDSELIEKIKDTLGVSEFIKSLKK